MASNMVFLRFSAFTSRYPDCERLRRHVGLKIGGRADVLIASRLRAAKWNGMAGTVHCDISWVTPLLCLNVAAR